MLKMGGRSSANICDDVGGYLRKSSFFLCENVSSEKLVRVRVIRKMDCLLDSFIPMNSTLEKRLQLHWIAVAALSYDKKASL